MTSVLRHLMRVLNVAEKNDAAKNISRLLAPGGQFNVREGFSKYNKIYEFPYHLGGQQVHMIMTSLSGHLLNHDFPETHRAWHTCDPLELFDAPVIRICMENLKPIKRTLEREIRNCDHLIIWTDCDREGESIGFEIIEVCTAIKRNVRISRAIFSEITAAAIQRAINNLGQPDARMNDAVLARQILDLRIGAAFTRFQTLRLKRIFPQHLADQLISYGSCQFPTLGFVVERFKEVENFQPEPFWKLVVRCTKNNLPVEFAWERVRLFDKLICEILLAHCLDAPIARVTSVVSKPTSKWRPQPMDTLALEMLSVRKLRLGAQAAMQIAEKLYTNGFISYPRTETTKFPPNMNLPGLVQNQTTDPRWGEFAQRILNEGGPNPRQGKKSDQAHPPIHPLKPGNNLQGNEARVYELVARHFLACVSKDAKGHETQVHISVNGETFSAKGLVILERNYLEVYHYEYWTAKELPEFTLHETFEPDRIAMEEGKTSAPSLLTEADLIALMDKHGIGTDATHAEHIETVKRRLYVGLDQKFLVPGHLGMGLVDGYDSMGFHMSKPNLRAELETDLKLICEGRKTKDQVLREQLECYRQLFQQAAIQARKLDQALAIYFNPNGGGGGPGPGGGGGGGRGPGPGGGGGGGGGRGPGPGGPPAPPPPPAPRPPREEFPPPLPPPPRPPVNPIISGPRAMSSGGMGAVLNGGGGSRTTTMVLPPSYNDTGEAGGGDLVLCACKVPATELTTKKEGPNKGRIFYKCGNNNGCDYFQWKDTLAGSTSWNKMMEVGSLVPSSSTFGGVVNNPRMMFDSSMTRGQSSGSQFPSVSGVSQRPGPSFGDAVPNCQCGVPGARRTVRKEGPNKGRSFFGCGHAPQTCNFFQWDETGGDGGGGGIVVAVGRPVDPSGDAFDAPQFMKTSGGRGRGGSRATGGPKAPPKCSNCGQPGHKKNKCPADMRDAFR